MYLFLKVLYVVPYRIYREENAYVHMLWTSFSAGKSETSFKSKDFQRKVYSIQRIK